MKFRIILACLFAWLAVTPASAFFFYGGTAAQRQLAGVFVTTDAPFNAAANLTEFATGSCSASSPTLTVSGGTFAAGDVGKPIYVGAAGSGSPATPLVTTISAVTNATTATLATNCLTTASSTVVAYGTDDTTAVQAAITAAFNHGGGTVAVPNGSYLAGPLQNPTTQNAVLVIPYVAPTSAPISISIIGQTNASNNVNCCNGPVLMLTGSILFSPLVGSGTQPALIAALMNGSSSNFSNVTLKFEDIYLRTGYLTSTPLSGLNAQWAAFSQTKNLTIDVAATATQQFATAPSSGGIGIITPANDNGALEGSETLSVAGYTIGLRAGEHLDMQNLSIELCTIGVQLEPGYHSLNIGRAYIGRNVTNIEADTGGPGEIHIQVANFDTEHSTSGWYQTTADVSDSNNEIFVGFFFYHVIVTNVGYDNTAWIKTGGSSFTATPF